MLISLDLETACNISECPGYGDTHKCDHALDPHRAKITVIGCYWEEGDAEQYKVFDTVSDFSTFLTNLPSTPSFLGHNLGFDIKMLRAAGVIIPVSNWEHDTLAMAVAYTHKVDDAYLEAYGEKRRAINKGLGKQVHRNAGGYSLKVLAPYFAGIQPFWETSNHSNKEYVIKDCKYTYQLHKVLKTGLKQDGTYDFYINKLMSWSRFLLEVELRGVRLDLDLMAKMEDENKKEITELKNKLDTIWAPAYREYARIQRQELYREYIEKYGPELKAFPDKEKAITKRALKSLRGKIQKIPKQMNLDSPAQLKWLFKDYLKLNIRNPEGDETTGAEVLEKLIMEGKEDISVFRDYKEKVKLLSSFFQSYKEKVVGDTIYCNYNIAGTRTGRLSSSQPNLQQVPGGLHSLFIARPGKLLATYDMSAIEPRLIAFFSEDPTLCDIMIRGDDFHGYAAKSLIEYVTCDSKEVKKLYKKERDLAKQVDLSLFYGSGVNRLMHTAHKHKFNWNKDECQYKLRMFKDMFQQVFRFKNNELDPMLIDGTVTNVLGRTYRIDDPEDVYMKGFNTLIQSSGSDLVVNSGMLIDEEFKKRGIDGGVLMLVHDELVVEIPENRKDECKDIIIEKMTSYVLNTIHGRINLEVEGKIAKSWEK